MGNNKYSVISDCKINQQDSRQPENNNNNKIKTISRLGMEILMENLILLVSSLDGNDFFNREHYFKFWWFQRQLKKLSFKVKV